MCIRVDLPEPDGPMMATYSRLVDLEGDAAQGLHLEGAGPVDLGDVPTLDDGGPHRRLLAGVRSTGTSAVSSRADPGADLRRSSAEATAARRRSRGRRRPTAAARRTDPGSAEAAGAPTEPAEETAGPPVPCADRRHGTESSVT